MSTLPPMAPHHMPHQGYGPSGFEHGGSDGQGLLAKFIVKYSFSQYEGTEPGEAYTVKEVTLENGLTGCIIGDKGSRIREVRSASGATIKIGDFDSAGEGERLITIEGTNIQCHLAEYMLQCCVQSFSGNMSREPPAPKRKKLRPDPTEESTSWDATYKKQDWPSF